MAFSLHSYQAPDFNALGLDGKPDVVLAPVVKDGVAPDNYHAMSIFPEYFKLDGKMGVLVVIIGLAVFGAPTGMGLFFSLSAGCHRLLSIVTKC